MRKQKIHVITDQKDAEDSFVNFTLYFDSEDEARLYYDNRVLTQVKLSLLPTPEKTLTTMEFSIHWYEEKSFNGSKREWKLTHEFMIEQRITKD